MHTARSSALLLAITFVSMTVVGAQTAAPTVTMNEASFWRVATQRVMPTYPAASLARRTQGVVVTSVTSTKEGRVERVDVLESPDSDMAAAVREALAQWTIPAPQPVGASIPYVARVKMTFYFRIQDGKGVVLSPDRVPGNEDVFARFNRPPAGRAGSPPTSPPVVVRHSSTAREIDDAEFTRLLANPATVVLDIRDRDQFASGAHPRAKNIPDNEVSTRARAELPVDAPVVIDCSRAVTALCHFAYDALSERGFKNATVYIP